MPLKGVTVLAVDDYEPHNYAIARLLEGAGSSVLRAHNGAQALQLASESPDAILLDINLPDMDGFEVCRRLHSNPSTAGIPVIFLTATYHDANAKAMAESVGARSILFYPVEKDQLLAVLQGEIARSKKVDSREG